MRHGYYGTVAKELKGGYGIGLLRGSCERVETNCKRGICKSVAMKKNPNTKERETREKQDKNKREEQKRSLWSLEKWREDDRNVI